VLELAASARYACLPCCSRHWGCGARTTVATSTLVGLPRVGRDDLARLPSEVVLPAGMRGDPGYVEVDFGRHLPAGLWTRGAIGTLCRDQV
jgi:hypothetical protein